MNYLQNTYTVSSIRHLTETAVDLWVDCPEMAALAVAGQFVNIRVPGFQLRRPISICRIDRENGRLRLVFEVKGGGTKALAALQPGDPIDLMGPLGHGFLIDEAKHPVLIGGGIGTPPMLETACRYGSRAHAIAGFRSAAQVILAEEFEAVSASFSLCTDDGSAGEHGFVTAALERVLAADPTVDLICACGPIPMLRGIAKIAEAHGIRCQVSMEERMACGVGACLGCACKTHRRDQDHHIIDDTYSHVCVNGPVFEAEDIAWE